MSAADVAALRQEYAVRCARDPWGEAAAVAVLLGFERLAADSRLGRHADRGGVHWDRVLADRTWSTGERFLLATAAALWNGRNATADVSQVAYLDDTFFTVWLAMIAAARTGRVPRPGALLTELRDLIAPE